MLPHAEVLIPGKISSQHSKCDMSWGMIVPDPDLSFQADGILVGRAVVDLRNGTIPIRILNLSKGQRKVCKGTELALCEPVSSVQHVQKQAYTCKHPTTLPTHLTALYEKSIESLDKFQKEEVKRLLTEYADVFSRDSTDLGKTDVVQHQINTGTATPIRQPPRRLPLVQREEAVKAVYEMENQEILEPSSSPWSSPIVLVRKKDGSLRFCVDYRKLNEVTKKDSYPLPRIDNTLQSLAGSKWFSTLDLRSGYWQVEIDPKDKAFSTGIGLWQFKVMPFGLCNAPATFERLMEQVLSGLPMSVCLVYLDDILVPSRTFEEQIVNLTQVFQRLQAAKLKLAPNKTSLFKKEVMYLGHVISKDGVTANPEKTLAIQTWPHPTNNRETKQFLGLCSYYRRFVPNFAHIAAPLHALTREQNKFVWSEEAEQAFLQLKRFLTAPPVLGYPEPGGSLHH